MGTWKGGHLRPGLATRSHSGLRGLCPCLPAPADCPSPWPTWPARCGSRRSVPPVLSSGWYSLGSWFWGWSKDAFVFYSRKILENGLLTWSLSDPEEGVSSSCMSCLYSQCRRQRPLETAVSATGGGGCRGAGAFPHGGPPAPWDVDSGAPPASVSARPGPAEPWAAGDKPHCHLELSHCQFSSVFWRY